MNWLALAVVIALIDLRKPTLSSNFRRGQSAHPALVTAGTAYVVAHLYGVIPEKYDPLRRVHLG